MLSLEGPHCAACGRHKLCLLALGSPLHLAVSSGCAESPACPPWTGTLPWLGPLAWMAVRSLDRWGYGPDPSSFTRESTNHRYVRKNVAQVDGQHGTMVEGCQVGWGLHSQCPGPSKMLHAHTVKLVRPLLGLGTFDVFLSCWNDLFYYQRGSRERTLSSQNPLGLW